LREATPLGPDDEVLFEALLLHRDDALAEAVAALRSLEVEGEQLSPSARVKTLATIREKLQRESVRLSQIQDIAGARIVTEGGLDTQDQIRDAVVAAFPGARVFDRRERPSYGYRAVHVVVTCQAVPVEIQIRTSDQHRWAEIFERLADTFGRQIRYGGEPDEPNADFFGITHRDVIELMMVLSEVISSKEYVLSTMGMKHDVHELLRQVATRWPRTDFPRAEAEAVRLLRARETGLAPLNAELDAMLDALSRLVEPR
jgi:hypothetical protein